MSVCQARKVFSECCSSRLQADMNQFDRIMRKLGVTDVYVNDRIFKCFDVDESGHVDMKEFCLGMTAAWEGTLAEKLVTYFKAIDKDDDG